MTETKKRPLNVQPKLGAGEFATILNGDDARQILSALRNFTKTVKRERRQALQVNGDSDDDEDDEVVESNKKLKEEWMQDSKDYNVPFVGTSVAKGETGRVVVGQWPTGFLEAYLRQSPLAVELTSDDLIPPSGHVHKRLLRQKQGKVSYAIYKAYLQALSELVTAAIPISTLKRDYGVETSEDDDEEQKEQPRFMTVLMKERFPGIVQILNDETGSGRGKDGSISGVGQLAVPVLQILTRLASCSLGTSRQVVRSLDSSVREGVLKVLLREPRKSQQNNNAADLEKDGDEEQEQRDRLAVPYKTRSSCIQLAVALLDMQDQSITSYISTLGSKERKNNPGLLYLALRYGFQDSMFQEQEEITQAQEDYLESVSILLQSTAVLLEEDKEGLLSRRALADLLGAEALMNMSQTATCAPPLTSYEDVLKGEDEYKDMVTSLEDVGIEARRLLFPLLANSSRSPFLRRISGKEDDKVSTIYITFMVKALNQLLNTSTSLPTQNFIIHSLAENPLLLPGFLKGMQIPDVKSTFTFLSKLHFIARIVKDGPSPSACIVTTDMSPRGIEKLMLVVLPQNLNKHLLSRAIQSSNPLIVAEAAKLIMRVLARFRLLLSSFGQSADQDLVSHAFVARLPDVQALVSIRSKFDPFANQQKGIVIVNGLICRLLDALAETVPSAIVSAKFDWIKLLPDNPSLFSKAKPVAQLQILQTLERIMKCKSANADETSSKPTPKACRALLEVAINATDTKIYLRARSIATEMLLRLVECPAERTEVSYCLEYEISMWVDGMDQAVLNEFQGVLDEVVKNEFRHKLNRIQAWKRSNLLSSVPDFPFTLLLSTGLSRLENVSDAFARLIYGIASRCLLFHPNPLPLAATIQHSCESQGKHGKMSLVLQEYSRSILDIRKATYDHAQSLVVAHQAEKLSGSLGGGLLAAGAAIDCSKATSSELVLYLRRCLQTIALVDGFVENEELKKQWVENANDAIRFFIQRGEFDSIVMILNHPTVSRDHLPKSSRGLIELLAVICAGSDDTHTVDFGGMTGSVASRLESPGAEIENVLLFDLLKVWFCNNFTKLPRYDEIGATLASIATASFTTKTNDERMVQALALSWIRHQRVPFSTQTAWDAWKAYTSDAEAVGQSEYPMIQAMEKELCKVKGMQACVLFVKISELGCHEFLGRCLRSLHHAKTFGTKTDQNMSLLSKAIDIGCGGISQSLLLLTAALDTETSSVESILTHYKTSAADFKDLWTSGFLDGALVSSTKHRDDELMRRSLTNTLKQTQTREGGFQIVREMVKCRTMDGEMVSTAQASHLLKSLVSVYDEGSLHSEHSGVIELVLVMDSLPQALKKAFRISDEDTRSVAFCGTLLEQSLHALENIESNLSSLSLVDVDSILKSCLKFGISNSQGELALLRSSCLKLVRLFLSMTSQPESVTLRESSALLRPVTIWSMVLSHSKFAEAIVPSDGSGGKEWKDATEELVNLLVCCASLFTDGLSIEKDTLNALFVAYNGGTVAVDIALRRLFSLIECMPGVQMPFGDEIGSALASSSTIEANDKGWGFLDNALDLRRVRDTLSQFPRCSYLSPMPLHFEKWAMTEVVADATMTEEMDSDQDSTTGSSSSAEYEAEAQPDVPDPDQGGEEPNSGDIWKGRGPDLRYDPSFVIPLIVVALESLVPEEHDEANSEQSADFAQLAQRLCDKGGLSLCLASLCSACPSLRKLAFSGLCLFLQAFDSEAAKDLTSWRERPQLKMLLNSVQLGFVLRKAMLASKGLSSEIPKLPSLSAIFLAKALLILTKPGDIMYSAMNKYFLKLNQGHGAYNDMTRLPAFMALFCSASDEHPERERQWVLQCLRDSFLGGYHMVASCHAPELLLTTLGRTRLDDVERLLILQVLTRLLQFGDKPATHHLLGRVGLLSWLHAFLVSQPLPDETAIAVLDLVEVAVQQGIKYTEKEHKDQFKLDLRNLLAPLAAMKTSGVSRVFCLVVHSLTELGYNETLSPAGLPISHSFQLLATSTNKTEMLEALCTAPLDHGDEAAIPQYCETMLRHLLEWPGANVSLVLQRVSNLAGQCRSTTGWSNEVVRLVLTMHSRAVRTEAYRDCLGALLGKIQKPPNPDDEDDCVSIATNIVSLLKDNTYSC